MQEIELIRKRSRDRIYDFGGECGIGTHLIPYVKQGAEAVADRISEMTEELNGAMVYTGVRSTAEFDASVIHRI